MSVGWGARKRGRFSGRARLFKSRGAAVALCVGLMLAGLNTGCFLKFWGKEKSGQQKPLDVYGTVEEITVSRLVIKTRQGLLQEFSIVDSSIKGSNFGPGATVHVYYRASEGVNTVTMVVEKR